MPILISFNLFVSLYFISWLVRLNVSSCAVDCFISFLKIHFLFLYIYFMFSITIYPLYTLFQLYLPPIITTLWSISMSFFLSFLLCLWFFVFFNEPTELPSRVIDREQADNSGWWEYCGGEGRGKEWVKSHLKNSPSI